VESILRSLIIPQLVNKFPAFNGNQGSLPFPQHFPHLSLPWARSIQSTPSQLISLRSTLILSSHLCKFIHILAAMSYGQYRHVLLYAAYIYLHVSVHSYFSKTLNDIRK